MTVHKSDEGFFRAFREGPVPVMLTSATDHRYWEVNKAFERVTGWNRDEVIGRTPFDISIWVEPQQRVDFVKRLLSGAPVQNLEFRYCTKDGDIRTGLGSAELIEINCDVCVLSIATDITERKQAEAALSAMSQRLIEAQEEDRVRIASDLRDNINQRLSLIAVDLHRLEQHLPAATTEVRHMLNEASKQVEDLANDIQALAHSLDSVKFKYLGLAAAAASYCTEFSECYKIGIAFHSENIPQDLPNWIALTLFRVLQEAVENATKHSGSRQIQVSLSGGTDEIQLTVHDSGTGFDPEEAMKEPGIGLARLKERLKMVNGTLSIGSQLGYGTTIEVRVPLP
jgi:PAS domain S-box-containing protein